MRRLRGLGRWAGTALWVVAVAPALALLAAAWLDRGPGGSVRLTPFPAALTALDPYVWDCTRNSLALAAAVTIAARVVGVGLARVVVRWRFWGRVPLAALAGAGAVVPPAFGVVGLRVLFGPFEAWPLPPVLGGLTPWVVLFWVQLAAVAPLVGLAAASALVRIDPVWEDAARLAGADRRRVWRQVVWPVVRPDVARALGLVFTLSLLEPGGPLVLGLRRTLGYQTAESALLGGVGTLPRAVVLALAATLLAGLARVMIGWWGGVDVPSAPSDDVHATRPGQASWLRGAAFSLVLTLAVFAAWLPAVGLFSAALRPAGPGSVGVTLAGLVRDPLTRGYLLHSAVVGLAALAVDLVLARALAAWALSERGRRVVDRLASWPEVLPPLAVGVGVLALPVALRMLADSLPASTSRPSPAELLRTVVDVFDPERTPWVSLVLAVALVRLPLLARSAVERRRTLRPVWVDAAVGLGATARQARKTLPGRLLGVPSSVALLTLALAATNVTPALLFAPAADTRPVGPAVLALIDEPDGGLARAAGLASIAVAVNLAGLAVAARGRAAFPDARSRS